MVLPPGQHHDPVRRRVPGLGHVPGARDGQLARRRPRPAAVPLHDPLRVRERRRRLPHRRRRASSSRSGGSRTGAGAAGAGTPGARLVTRRDATDRRRAPSTRSLARSSAVVGAGTLLSRITGFLRVSALAALGFARLTDVYNLANSTPNIVYELLARRDPHRDARAALRRRHYETRRPGRVTTRSTPSRSRCSPPSPCSALIAAPWIIDVYSGLAGVARRGAQARAAGARHRPAALVHAADVLLRRHRARHRDAERPPPVRRRGVRAGAQQRRRDRGAARRGAGRAASRRRCTRVLDDPVLVLLLGLGTTAGIVAMALVLVPAAAPRRRPTSTGTGSRATRRSASSPASRAGPSATSRRTRSRSSSCSSSRTVTAADVSIYLAAFTFFQLPARPVRGDRS